MQTDFYKYQGTGNDFVMIDNRDGAFPKNDTTAVKRLCDRRFGIGGDGLILLEDDKNSDFRMVYFNADGNEGSMCGNGGRCTVAFAKYLGIVSNQAGFVAVDGFHSATISAEGLISLGMNDVKSVAAENGFCFLNTGSPHHVQIVENVREFNVRQEGAAIRYAARYGNAGTNVNFVTQEDADIFSVRTYERGVEDETLSCGTGVTAVAIAMHATGRTSERKIYIITPGGRLDVSFDVSGGVYTNVVLTGPAEFVFQGTIQL